MKLMWPSYRFLKKGDCCPRIGTRQIMAMDIYGENLYQYTQSMPNIMFDAKNII